MKILCSAVSSSPRWGGHSGPASSGKGRGRESGRIKKKRKRTLDQSVWPCRSLLLRRRGCRETGCGVDNHADDDFTVASITYNYWSCAYHDHGCTLRLL